MDRLTAPVRVGMIIFSLVTMASVLLIARINRICVTHTFHGSLLGFAPELIEQVQQRRHHHRNKEKRRRDELKVRHWLDPGPQDPGRGK